MRYTTQNAVDGKPSRIVRPRTLIYAGGLAALLAVFAGSLALRVPVELDVIRDRNALYREAAGGLIRNVYTLKIVNMHDEPLRRRVGVSGIEGLRLDVDDPDRVVAPGEVASMPVRLDVSRDAIRSESTPVRFTVEAIGAVEIRASEETRFLGPAPGGVTMAGDSSRPTVRGSSRASPWHREPLVWMVLATPAAAGVVGAVMLMLANVTWDGLVADDYNRRGMEINRALAPRRGGVATRAPRLRRVPGAGDDVRAPLTRDAAGRWRGTLPAIEPGKWYLELGNEQWRLAAPLRMPASGEEFVLYAPVGRASAPRSSTPHTPPQS